MQPTFDNTYARLPERFYARQNPDPVKAPAPLRVNRALATRLGFDPDFLETPEGAAFIVGNKLFHGSEPLAMAYAGHQFGNWVPQLGDGRALLLGEFLDADGQRFDLHIKGSGRTPFSRQGDGRAPLGPVLREYLISEAMAHLHIPTTRVLATALTGQKVRRNRILPGAVLLRLAKSHIRIGTFEYFAARQDTKALQILINYTLHRHYPAIHDPSPRALLDAFANRLAYLVASWQSVSFIHGVMNTDNLLLSGETIDYGPCAFMNEYDPQTVFSSIDQHGRYAYGNQPPIAQWNLARFAEALAPAVPNDNLQAYLEHAQTLIDNFPDLFQRTLLKQMLPKLGLPSPTTNPPTDDSLQADQELLNDLLTLMKEHRLDFTLTFRALTQLAGPQTGLLPPDFPLPSDLDPWLARWQARLHNEPRSPAERQAHMRALNPVFIPRNHKVDAALHAAIHHDDLTPFDDLLELLRDPFTYRDEHRTFALPPQPEERIAATFCGT